MIQKWTVKIIDACIDLIRAFSSLGWAFDMVFLFVRKNTRENFISSTRYYHVTGLAFLDYSYIFLQESFHYGTQAQGASSFWDMKI